MVFCKHGHGFADKSQEDIKQIREEGIMFPLVLPVEYKVQAQCSIITGGNIPRNGIVIG